jgi:hypothetical protein
MNDPANEAQVQKTIVKYIKVDQARAKELYAWIDSFQNDFSRSKMERTFAADAEAGMLPSPAPSYEDLCFDLSGKK